MKSLRNFRFLFPLAVAGIACTSVLGIEEVHEGPKPGSGADTGDGGDNGNGGTGGNRGGTGASSGAAGSAGRGGGSGASTGGAGGAAGDMGGGGDGNAGSGTGGVPDEGTVTGRIIDFWGRAVPAVPVEIGAQVVQADADGEFTIEDVAPQYDVNLFVSWEGGMYGWRFEGLTRRDPTLQVYAGLPERDGYLTFTPMDATLTGSRRCNVSFGGPDTMLYYSDVPSNGSASIVDWRGPATTSVVMRGLVFSFDSMTYLPTGYHAYASGIATLSDTIDADVSLSLPDDPNIQTGNITGTVNAVVSENRTNSVYVRFANDDGSTSAIQVVNEYYSGPDTFTYLVPSLPESAIFVTASSGNYGDGPYSLAYKDNVAPGQNVSLEIPAAPTPVSPAGQATPPANGADTSTVFRWTGTSGGCVLYFEDQDAYEGAFVVTANTQTTLPTFPGYALYPGSRQHWRIETHGDFADVDAMAGPNGYLQSVIDTGHPRGRKRGDGVYTISTWYQVFIAE
jgi:hypothetical protein